MNKILILCFTTLGALLSRWHGGGFFKSPKLVKTALFALFPTAALAIILFPMEMTNWQWLGWCVFCFAVTGAIKATGHGGFFDLGTSEKEPYAGRDLEKIEALLYPWAYDLLPRYWYDSLGMLLKGTLMSLGMVIPLLIYSPVLAIPALLGGCMLSPCYMIGRLFTERYATEFGEYAGGFFFYLGAVMALVYA